MLMSVYKIMIFVCFVVWISWEVIDVFVFEDLIWFWIRFIVEVEEGFINGIYKVFWYNYEVEVYLYFIGKDEINNWNKME